VLIVLNVVFYAALIIGWFRIPLKTKPLDLSFSIIIPVRNEVKNVVDTLHALELQDYPKSRFEVIIVDDFSSDKTFEIAEQYFEKSEISYQLHRLSRDEGEGKKCAITKGVALSKFDHIITTDADCSMGKFWLQSYAAHFLDNQMVAGPVSITSDSIFSKFQQIEFAGLIGFGAVTISQDEPSMCSGANLGFMKEAFRMVGGYSDNISIPSGDDEFLLYSILKEYPGKVSFMKDKQAVVETPPHRAVSSFLNQRKRWTSKWKHNKNWKLRAVAVLFFLENISFLILGLVMCFGLVTPYIFLFLFLVRFAISTSYMNIVNRFLGNSLTLIIPVAFQIFYPFHVLLMGMNSIFGTYTWKDRKY